jgi:hypothetical protein
VKLTKPDLALNSVCTARQEENGEVISKMIKVDRMKTSPAFPSAVVGFRTQRDSAVNKNSITFIGINGRAS